MLFLRCKTIHLGNIMENKTKIILVVLVLLVVCGVGIQMFMSPDAVNSSGNQTVTDMANKSLEKNCGR